MFRILFLLFLTVPLVEIYFLIQIGQEFGALRTVLLCILTAALGAILLKIQGILTLLRAREKLRQGEIPADNLLEGLILLIAGVLLLTPGLHYRRDRLPVPCPLAAFHVGVQDSAEAMP